jgi:hypothetical protein
MKIGSENQGEFGWYEGDLQRDGFTGNYRVTQGMNSALVPGSSLLDEVFDVRKEHGIDVMLHGRLDVEEAITGTLGFELQSVDRAAAVLEEDYEGWTVGVSGNDLVFSEDCDYSVYEGDSIEELERNLMSWFDDVDQYMGEVNKWNRELDSWPWKV